MFLQTKKVSYSYSDKLQVLQDVSFTVGKAEVIAIVGASGSGKSTILRLIAGILQGKGKLTGDIHIDGHTPAGYLKLNKLGFMFQQPTLFPNLTVRENIELPFSIKGQSNPERIQELIQSVGLNGFEDFLPKQLSGGMRTRVSLARSFATNPELLLLDEPFSSLDVAWKDALYQELKLLIKNFGTTVILVTHDIKEAIELADTIVCLGMKGKILFEKKNTKSAALYTTIENTIIKDHKLRHDND